MGFKSDCSAWRSSKKMIEEPWFEELRSQTQIIRSITETVGTLNQNRWEGLEENFFCLTTILDLLWSSEGCLSGQEILPLRARRQGRKMRQTGANLSSGLLLVGVGNTLSIFVLQCTETLKSKFSFCIDLIKYLIESLFEALSLSHSIAFFITI